MNRALGVALLAAVLWAPAGCHRKRNAAPQAAIEEGPRTATMVTLGDPKSAPQLVSGFYDIENGAWRWTARRFSMTVGARIRSVRLKVTIPENVGAPLTLVGAGARYVLDRLGDHECMFEVSDGPVEFELDRALPPDDRDGRERGIVVRAVEVG